MRALLTGVVVVGLSAGLLFALAGRQRSVAADDSSRLLAHDVYFSLNDNSDAAKQKLVAACKKYLTKHEGTVFFATGTRAQELSREFNAREFDVSLHIVFKNKE